MLLNLGRAQERKQKDFLAVSPSVHPEDLYSPFLTATAVSNPVLEIRKLIREAKQSALGGTAGEGQS